MGCRLTAKFLWIIVEISLKRNKHPKKAIENAIQFA
jgi:hypothetical protein